MPEVESPAEEAGHRPGDTISRWVCFRIANQLFGLPILSVHEVLRDAEIEPVPGTTSQVLGVINLRGNVVTVIDLRVRLGLPSHPPDSDSRIVIIEHRGETFGLMVDQVADVRKIIDGAITSAPDTGSGEHSARLRGVYTRDGGMLMLFDEASLIEGTRFVE